MSNAPASQTPAASLHTGLLAAKGNAKPSRNAARPETLLGEKPASSGALLAAVSPPPGGSSARLIFRALADQPPRKKTATPARLSLRIDERQRLRLRLASAHLGRSRQDIVLAAIEHYLSRVVPTFIHGPCSCIGGAHAGACLEGKTP